MFAALHPITLLVCSQNLIPRGFCFFDRCFFYKQHFYKQYQTEIGKKSINISIIYKSINISIFPQVFLYVCRLTFYTSSTPIP